MTRPTKRDLSRRTDDLAETAAAREADTEREPGGLYPEGPERREAMNAVCEVMDAASHVADDDLSDDRCENQYARLDLLHDWFPDAVDSPRDSAVIETTLPLLKGNDLYLDVSRICSPRSSLTFPSGGPRLTRERIPKPSNVGTPKRLTCSSWVSPTASWLTLTAPVASSADNASPPTGEIDAMTSPSLTSDPAGHRVRREDRATSAGVDGSVPARSWVPVGPDGSLSVPPREIPVGEFVGDVIRVVLAHPCLRREVVAGDAFGLFSDPKLPRDPEKCVQCLGFWRSPGRSLTVTLAVPVAVDIDHGAKDAVLDKVTFEVVGDHRETGEASGGALVLGFPNELEEVVAKEGQLVVVEPFEPAGGRGVKAVFEGIVVAAGRTTTGVPFTVRVSLWSAVAIGRAVLAMHETAILVADGAPAG